MTDLVRWKNSTNRKPLIIKGARQVGKTWLMKEFGKLRYEKTVYLNFEKNKRLAGLFTSGFDLRRLIIAFQVESGITIQAENTLLIFDEIQAVPEAITSLKYFYEDGPEFHLVAAGSLLGVALHAHVSFPVGKVEFMDLFPLTYAEFLNAVGDQGLVELLNSGDQSLITVFKSKFTERLKQYYFVGGMPEAVLHFSESGNFNGVREIQEQILVAYESDFSKHAPVSIIPRIRMVWNSVPAQLAKGNRKFIYGLVKESSRAKDYELALSWLIDCGQAHKVHRVNKPGLPLKAYEDISSFKLFIADVGLFSAMCNLDSGTILENDKLFTEFKGALTEQFVFQQLNSEQKYSIYYWSGDKSTAEVDFIVQFENRIIPIEVKAIENLQAKSLKVYREKFKPEICIRTSLSDYRQESWLINIPLYALQYQAIGNRQ